MCIRDRAQTEAEVADAKATLDSLNGQIADRQAEVTRIGEAAEAAKTEHAHAADNLVGAKSELAELQGKLQSLRGAVDLAAACLLYTSRCV